MASDLGDEQRARAALKRASEAAGSQAPSELLQRRLDMARAANDLAEAAELAEKLLQRAIDPPLRARRLREAAALAATIGNTATSRDWLREALELEPQDEEAVALLSGLLAQAGDHDAAAQLLTRTLATMPPPPEELRVARAVLWRRLGDARDKLRDARGAVQAWERALEANPSQRDLRELVLERYAGDATMDDAARQHLAILIADEPLHPPSLRALAKLEQRRGDDARARRLTELLAIAGAANDEEAAALRKHAHVQPADEPYKGALEEKDHALLAHPDARALGEVFAALWEATAAATRGLDALGVKPEDRVSPVSDLDVAKAFGACARALGNRRTGLFVKWDPSWSGVALVAQPPTAIVVGPQLADGRATAALRFQLGRALEIARPEYVLSAAMQPEEFAKLLTTILRTFHPRHARRAADANDETARWKRELPYKVARRLGELFREHAETEFSSALWRRAVQHTGNRAGLLVCGDLVAAAAVLRAEGDEPAIAELARFASSEACAQLQAKIDGSVVLSY
jgi:tetratricopeptide (TPR) repeat protein